MTDELFYHWLGIAAEEFHSDWPEGMLIGVPEVDLTDMQAEYE